MSTTGQLQRGLRLLQGVRERSVVLARMLSLSCARTQMKSLALRAVWERGPVRVVLVLAPGRL